MSEEGSGKVDLSPTRFPILRALLIVAFVTLLGCDAVAVELYAPNAPIRRDPSSVPGPKTGSVLRQLWDIIRPLFAHDASAPSFSFRVMRNGSEAEVTGDFTSGLTAAFLRVLDASPRIRVVHLDSPGGSVGEGLKLSKVIRDRGIVTYVATRCLSACTLAFAGGRERWLGNGAALGFHAASFPSMSNNDVAALQTRVERKERALFASAGFDPAFVERAVKTPNKDIWLPSADELLRARVVTAISDGTRFAASGVGGDVTLEQLSVRLAKIMPMLAALQKHLPKDYVPIIAAYYAGYQSGHSWSELNVAARRKLAPILIANRPLADDAVLVDLVKLSAEQFAALGAEDPRLCYLYASSSNSAVDVTTKLSRALVERDVALAARIIATAAKRPTVTDEMTLPLIEKVILQLEKSGVSRKIIGLLSEKIDPSQYALYCSTLVKFELEVLKLTPREAALVFRQTFQEELRDASAAASKN